MPAPRPALAALLLSLCLLFAPRALAAPHVLSIDPQPFPPDYELAAEDADNRLPRLTHKVEAEYPASLLDRPVRDRVFVAFVVDAKGQVKNVRACFGSHAACEQAAVAAVEQWRFTPGRHEGHFVSTQMTAEFRFEPDGATGEP